MKQRINRKRYTKQKEDKLFFKFNVYPLRIEINLIPGCMVSDKEGNVYEVQNDLKVVKILKSPLVRSEFLTQLNEICYFKLYITIARNELKINEGK